MDLYRKWQVFRISLLFFKGTPIVFAAILTSACVAVSWLFLLFVDIKKDRIHNILELEAAKLESELINKVDHTFAIMNSIVLQIAKDPHNKAHINSILSTFNIDSDLSEELTWSLFSWTNSHHNVTVDTKYGILDKPHSLAMRQYMPLAIEKPHELHLGGLASGSTSKQWIITAGVGAVDKNGKYLGALATGFRVDALSKALNAQLEHKNVGFELVSQDGLVILYGYKPSFNTSKGGLAERDLIKYMLKTLRYSQDRSSISDIALFKERHAILTKRIKNFPYYLILRYDDQALQDELLKSFTSRLKELLLLSFAALSLFIFIYKREKRQNRKIAFLKKIAKQKQ